MNKTQSFLLILSLIFSCTAYAKEDRSVVSEQPAQDEEIYAETYIAPSVAQSQGLYIEGDFEGIGVSDYGTEGIAKVTELHKSSAISSEYFPLTEGSRWVYQDSLEIQDPDGKHEIESKYTDGKVRINRTNSLRTVKVLSVENKGLIKTVETEEEDFQGVKTIITDYLYPLKVGVKWAYPDLPDSLNREDNMYAYYVEDMEDVTVPAGTFKNCFKIVFRTVPEHIIEWFHPEVGVVKVEYVHHGTVTNWVSELKEFRKK
ncbi:MAG: hypothetical protein KKB46_00430 [Candidatus Omnitrophica bacterium]|nr:hypothetical protein [Candidatus Omnitrophota bacterium]